MTPTVLLILTLLAIAVAAASATGVHVLHEFWRHELEEHCRRRNKLNWFKRILELREELALGAQTLQMISIATSVTCGLLYFFATRNNPAVEPSQISPLALPGLIGLWTLILLAANCWIPWGVMKIAAPSFLYRTWRMWWAASLFLAPLTAGVEVFATLISRITGKKESADTDEENFEDEIRSIVSEGQRDGYLESDALEMIKGVFDLDDSVVNKVMTPRSRVDVVDIESSWKELTELVADKQRTRLPLVRGQFSKSEDVIGVLFVKDIFTQLILPPETRRSLHSMARPALFVPATKPLNDLLKRFLAERIHMAIVIDEHGSVAGVITIEDILEEIVGEIVDENDDEPVSEIVRMDNGVVQIDGSVRIDQLNDELGLQLSEDEDYSTVSGWILCHLNAIPKSGQQVVIGDLKIEIQQASRRTIERVQLLIPDKTTTES